MLRNYIIIALRSLRNSKVFTLINVCGLAIGLACCMWISLYVYDELHYDTYSPNANHIYRVGIHLLANNGMETYSNVDEAVGRGITNAVAGVRDYTRLMKAMPSYVTVHDQQFKEEGLGLVDSNFFSFFSLPLLNGNVRTALVEPNSIVLTKGMAQKYFGNAEAVGQFIKDGGWLLKVTGIMADIPANAHFHFDGVISMSTMPVLRHTWSNVNYYTYLLLDPTVSAKQVEGQFPGLVAKYVVPEVAHDMGVSMAEAQKSVGTFQFFLTPLRSIHLTATTKYELEPGGDIQYVYIFSALAVFILLLACVNFTNLSTAVSFRRGREVGIRKVLGSVKGQLIRQFLVESTVLALLAFILAFGLVVVLLPYFNDLSAKHFGYAQLFRVQTILFFLGLALGTGLCAGMYPAFFLSSFNVIKVLKGVMVFNKGTIPLRSTLVVFQFFVSTSLIIATLMVYRQLHYMQDRKLGFDNQQVVYVKDTYLLGSGTNQQAFEDQLKQDSRVISVSLGTDVPGETSISGTVISPKDKQSTSIPANIFYVDENYIPTLGMKVIQGRNFSRDFPSDSSGVIINEAAVRDLGWSSVNPIGKVVVRSGQIAFKVVGVVADFNYRSLKSKIAPLMLLLPPSPSPGLIIKVNAPSMSGFLSDLGRRWKAYNPGAPFAYEFLDESFARLYTGEQRTAGLFSMFATLSILIACLGLFGLAAFTTEQRAREISIRKVLGASVNQVLVLVSKEFLWLVSIAFVLSVPFTWWAMHIWLQDFAYRAPVAIWVFLAAGLITLLIAILTVSSRAIKAALTNPVKSLRSF
jgi:putative ABC transport system permease protein